MDYEKKYKEALERATKAKNNASISNGTLRVLGIIFPELQESEEEKIIKAIKQMYSFLPNKPEYIGSVSVKDIFAWLEKQVKKSKISSHENKTCKENDDSLTCKIINALCTITKYAERELGLDAIDGVDIEDICYWLKKQGQSFLILSNSSKTGKKWTEEDFRVIDNCCLLIAAADDSYEKAFKDDCIHYLQNLKQRMEQ